MESVLRRVSRARDEMFRGNTAEQIIAVPTWIKKLTLHRYIGDMSQTECILLGLELQETPIGLFCLASIPGHVT